MKKYARFLSFGQEKYKENVQILVQSNILAWTSKFMRCK
jgi:hypothetical protein